MNGDAVPEKDGVAAAWRSDAKTAVSHDPVARANAIHASGWRHGNQGLRCYSSKVRAAASRPRLRAE